MVSPPPLTRGMPAHTHPPPPRGLLRVHGRPEPFEATLKMSTLLMGKGEASGRRAWMEEKGDSVEADV